jgi:hypothetical protein
MPNGISAAISTIAGFLVVLVGILALFVLALVGINALPEADKAKNVISIITGTGGVIGTIVGAYFGVKLGTAGTQEANARAVEMAAIADPERARQRLDEERRGDGPARAAPQA